MIDWRYRFSNNLTCTSLFRTHVEWRTINKQGKREALLNKENKQIEAHPTGTEQHKQVICNENITTPDARLVVTVGFSFVWQEKHEQFESNNSNFLNTEIDTFNHRYNRHLR